MTYTNKLESFEILPGHNRDCLILGQKKDLGRHQRPLELLWKSHCLSFNGCRIIKEPLSVQMRGWTPVFRVDARVA